MKSNEKIEKNKVFFVLPFVNMISNYVRGECLRGFEPNGWKFNFIKGNYPKILDFFPARYFYRLYFFLVIVAQKTTQNSYIYFLTPQNPNVLFFLSKFLKRKVIIDIQDAIQSKELLGIKKASRIIKNSDHVIFESEENSLFWSSVMNFNYSIIEDTPQHENLYRNFILRKKKVIWVGSKQTAVYLKNFHKEFKLFEEFGYSITLLGCDNEVANSFRHYGINIRNIESYNRLQLAKELESSRISFIPMENSDLFNLRGNLKAKISMSYGCLTIASDLAMHKRLIKNSVNGFLFSNFDHLKIILTKIEDIDFSRKVSESSNAFIVKNYSRKKHAKKLTDALMQIK